MAATDSRPIPKKNTAYRLYAPIMDADGDLVTGATGLDSEVSIDGGTFADCTNEATEVATSSGIYYLDLTSSEMNGDAICVIIKTSSSGAKTTPIILYPEEAGDIRVDVVQISGDTTAADNAEAFFDGTGYAGTNNVIPTVTTTTTATNVTTVNGLASGVITATAIAADAITAAKIADGAIDAATFAAGAITAAAIATDAIDADALATDAVTEIQAGLATAADLATVDGIVDAIVLDTNELQTDWTNGGRLDLLIDAIKAKTDNLPAAPAATGDIPSAAVIADAVWDESATGHTDAGKAGEQLWTDVDAILADTNEVQAELADGGRLDLLIDGIKAVTDVIPDNGALTALLADVAAILADTGTDGVVLSSATQQAIADVLLGRSVANVEDTATVYTVAGLILAAFESSAAGTVWTINKTDGATQFATRTLTLDAAADPITGVT